jgi:hypothetical protein
VGRPGFGNDDELTVVRSRVLPGDVNAVLLLNDATTVNFRGHDSCPTRQRTSQRGEGRDSPGLTPVSARARSVPDYTVSSALLHVNRNLEGSMRGADRLAAVVALGAMTARACVSCPNPQLFASLFQRP